MHPSHSGESSVLFQAFFEAAEDCCCAVTLEQGVRLLHANASFRQWAGLDGALGPGTSLRVLDDPWWRDLLGQVAAGRQALRACISSPGGRWLEVHAFPLARDEALVGLRLRDITEHRLMVERLIGLRRIRTLGVIFWGEGFSLADVNEGFIRMSGYSRDEALGKTWQELTPAEFHPQSWNAVRQVLTHGEAVPYEKQYIRKDGSRWWGLFAPRKIGDQVVEFVLDVTERRRAEDALRTSDRRKDEFLATLAHELRNPLAPIKNGMQILRLAQQSDPTQRTLQIIDRQLDHLIRLVDDLLDVARITRGKVRIERRRVSLRDVLVRSLESTQAALDARQHALAVELPAEDLCIAADADRLTQVFANLLSNAIKYTPPRGRIEVRTEVQASHLRVTVQDSGVGIAPEQQAGVFELFSQVRDHQVHSEGGLGIGLALVQSLVRLHDGSVDVHSEGPGRGSTFTVTLPRVEPSAAAAAPPPRVPAAVAPRRVLVADDNFDAADTLASLLRAAGHEVVTASDGLQAVSSAREFRPDVAFLDLGMPVMDGLQAAREIRTDTALAGITLVALTGWGQASDRQRTADAGFDLHLVKPMTANDLQAALGIAGGPARTTGAAT